jgi:methionyl-tRNA synthetase
MNKYYITNAIPYVNGKLHVGHSLEFLHSDTIARFHRLKGDEVLYLCGTDENALKNVQSAEAAGEEVQSFVDRNAAEFKHLTDSLSVSFDVFQKTSDQDKHYVASQKLWELCSANGDIYKKTYKGLYCVGCEEFKSPEDLVNGECPEHPGKKIEEVEEENYFFRLSKYQDQLLSLFESNTYEIVPDFRRNEIISFIKSGLEDFSISRSNERAKNWGIPVPGDNSQRIYVWFDALNVYQSGIGFGWDEENYKKWWPADLHVIGKGIIRFHAVYWPAILLSAKLLLPKQLFAHGYLTVDGKKIGKSNGNAIDPLDIVSKYGVDAFRYYCLAKFSPVLDGDFSEDRLRETYTSDLANGLGNLVARVGRLAETNTVSVSVTTLAILPEVAKQLDEFKFNEALEAIWREIAKVDKNLNDTTPWKLSREEATPILVEAIKAIRTIAYNLQPFLPETGKKILEQYNQETIKSRDPLFPRLT